MTAAGPNGATAWTCRSIARRGCARDQPAAARPAPARAAPRAAVGLGGGLRLRRLGRSRLLGGGFAAGRHATPAHGSTSLCGARIWQRAWLTATMTAVVRASPRRVRPVGRVGDRDEVAGSSPRASRSGRSGRRWMRPVMRNGGTEIIASSATRGLAWTGSGSTTSSETTNRTDARLTWAKSARIGLAAERNSSKRRVGQHEEPVGRLVERVGDAGDAGSRARP